MLNNITAHLGKPTNNMQPSDFWTSVEHVWYYPAAHPWFVGLVWVLCYVALFAIYTIVTKLIKNRRLVEKWGPKVLTGVMILLGVALYNYSTKPSSVKLFDVDFPDVFTPVIYVLVAFLLFKFFISLSSLDITTGLLPDSIKRVSLREKQFIDTQQVDIALSDFLASLQTNSSRQALRCMRLISGTDTQLFVYLTIEGILVQLKRRMRRAGIKCRYVISSPHDVSMDLLRYFRDPIVYRTAIKAKKEWVKNQERIWNGKEPSKGIIATDEKDRTIISKLIEIHGGRVMTSIDIGTAVAPESVSNFWRVCESALKDSTISDLSEVQTYLAIDGIYTLDDAKNYLNPPTSD